MNSIQVDPVYRTARVAPGVLGASWMPLRPGHSLALTGGQISMTGVAGLTLGGGLGWLMRDGGLTVDSLVSVDMVNAQGELLTVSATSHPDLFWAVRGGGGNFSVVTSFEFRLRTLGEIIGGTVAHPMSRAADLLDFFNDYAARAPDVLTPMAYFFSAPDLDVLPEAIRGAPWRRWPCATRATGSRRRAPGAAPRVRASAGGSHRSYAVYAATGTLRRWLAAWLPELLAVVVSAAAHARRNRHHRKLRPGRDVSAVDRPAHPDGRRRSTSSSRGDGVRASRRGLRPGDPRQMGRPGRDASKHIAWADAFFEAMRPFSTGGSYVNFLDDEGDARIRAAFRRLATPDSRRSSARTIPPISSG